MIDINKKVEMCMLADFYSSMLTERQFDIFSKFWEQDWSLFEIAEELKISRQAVHDSLSKSENFLIETEKKCGFVKKFNEIKQNLNDLLQNLDIKDKKQLDIYKKISDIISKL